MIGYSRSGKDIGLGKRFTLWSLELFVWCEFAIIGCWMLCFEIESIIIFAISYHLNILLPSSIVGENYADSSYENGFFFMNFVLSIDNYTLLNLWYPLSFLSGC